MQNISKNSFIELKDLESLESFRVWINKQLNHLYKNKKIPNQHLLIYLSYMKDIVGESDKVYIPDWLEAIRSLEANIDSIERVKNR